MTCLNYAEAASVAAGLYSSNRKVVMAARYDLVFINPSRF